jgi:hypothetical protein
VLKHGVFSMTWKQNDRVCSGKQNLPCPKKAHMSRLQVKTMLVCFFDHKGIVHYGFIAQGQRVNQQCYVEVLTRLRERVRSKSSHKVFTSKETCNEVQEMLLAST